MDKTAYQLRFDELNALKETINEAEGFLYLPKEEAKRQFEECLFWFYVDGFSSGILVAEDMPNGYDLLDIRYPDGQTVLDKFNKYYDDKDAERMKALIDSEAHRMWTTGGVEAIAPGLIDPETGRPTVDKDGKPIDPTTGKPIAPNSPLAKLKKKWVTMQDSRVRDQHWMLEGKTIPFTEDFVTADGDWGFAPGMFQTAENNANCRCTIEIK